MYVAPRRSSFVGDIFYVSFLSDEIVLVNKKR